MEMPHVIKLEDIFKTYLYHWKHLKMAIELQRTTEALYHEYILSVSARFLHIFLFNYPNGHY